MKAIVLLLDGVGDRTFVELGGKTPLEYAKTPNLDMLCKKAETGIMVPWRQGVPLGTEMAHFILFGYDPSKYPGRTVIDAQGEGLTIEKGRVYMRTSWAWTEKLNGGFMLRDRFTQELSKEEAMELSRALPKEFQGCRFEWVFSYDSHGFLVMEGEDLSSMISDADPFYKDQHVMKIEPFETDDEKAVRTAGIMNRYLLECSRVLYGHEINARRMAAGMQPANFLMIKWAAEHSSVTPFHRQNGMEGAVLGQSRLMRGLAQMLGMEYIKYDTLETAIETAIEGDWDFVHVHTKAPDEAAHTKNPFNKVKAIEGIDERIGRLAEALEDTLLIVTGDHSTPSGGALIHSGEPVPIMFIGEGLRVDDVESFGERSCAKGSIRMNGTDLIPMILNMTDRAKLCHLRSGPRDILYTPQQVNKLEAE